MEIRQGLHQQKQKKAKKVTNVKRIALSGVIMALYTVIMLSTQSFASGQYQIRIATSLYSLSALYPFLIFPLGLANALGNILGGFGIYDIVGGLIAGVITSSLTYFIKKYNLNDWLVALPVIFGPGLIVPVWLSYLLKLPYAALALSLTIGQIIPGIVGVLLMKQLRKIF